MAASIAACIEGDHNAVTPLLHAEQDLDAVDSTGWLPIEHVAYSGNLQIAEHLEKRQGLGKSVGGLRRPKEQIKPPQNRSIVIPRERNILIIRLGSSNTRSPRDAVDLRPLDDNSLAFTLKAQLISGEQSYAVDLPLESDEANSSWIFEYEDSTDASLKFEICSQERKTQQQSSKVIGTGVALLSEIRRSFIKQHESLVRDHTIPILSADRQSFLTTVTFNLLIVKPYQGSKSRPDGRQGFWSGSSRTSIVGHRGFGANKAKQKYLQIGENTIQGFKAAASLGASCVEFDVQLSKDFVPIIYHDFLIKDTGTETPIHTLTKDQFLYIGQAQEPYEDLPSAAEHRFYSKYPERLERARKQRSKSLNEFDDSRTRDMIERLRVTSYGPTKAVKGNRRGFTVQEPFCTLEALLMNVPSEVALDLEMKYPMLWEAENQQFEPWAMEINFFIDTILSMVYTLAGNRNITFSSFSPEICISLALKQQDYPVMFITKAGNVPTGDIRTSSLKQAVKFATAWGLAGIVSIIKPFQICPRLVGYIKSYGLVVAAYGTTADDPDTVKMLSHAGLDAIITNRVRLMHDTLRPENQ